MPSLGGGGMADGLDVHRAFVEPQNDRPRLLPLQNDRPRLLTSQNDRPRLLPSQNDSPRLLIDLTADAESGDDDVTPTMPGATAQFPVMIDLTQETAGPGAGPEPATAPELDASPEQFVHTFLLMLHAHKCRRLLPVYCCTFAGCERTRTILAHMDLCSGSDLASCQVDGCNMYRQIISHWKNCTDSSCSRCCQLKTKLRELNIRKRTDNRATEQTRDPVSNLLGISSANNPDNPTTSSTTDVVVTTSSIVDQPNNGPPLVSVSGSHDQATPSQSLGANQQFESNGVTHSGVISIDDVDTVATPSHDHATPSQSLGANQQFESNGVTRSGVISIDDVDTVAPPSQNIRPNVSETRPLDSISASPAPNNQTSRTSLLDQLMSEETSTTASNPVPLENLLDQPAAADQYGPPVQVDQVSGSTWHPNVSETRQLDDMSSSPTHNNQTGRNSLLDQLINAERSQVDRISGPAIPGQVGLDSGSPTPVGQGRLPTLPVPDVEQYLSNLHMRSLNADSQPPIQSAFSFYSSIPRPDANETIAPPTSQEAGIHVNGSNTIQQVPYQSRPTGNHDSIIDSLLGDGSLDAPNGVSIAPLSTPVPPPAYLGLSGNLYRQRSQPNESPFQFGFHGDSGPANGILYDSVTQAPPAQILTSSQIPDRIPPPAHAQTTQTVTGSVMSVFAAPPLLTHAPPTPTPAPPTMTVDTGNGRTSSPPAAPVQTRRNRPRWCRHEHELRVHLTCLREPHSSIARNRDLLGLRPLGLGIAFHEDGGRTRGVSVLFTDWDRAEVDEYIRDVFPVLREHSFHLCTTVGRSRRIQRLPLECRSGHQIREHFLSENRRTVPHIYIRPDVRLTYEELHRAMGRSSPIPTPLRGFLLPTSPASPYNGSYSDDDSGQSYNRTARRSILINRKEVVKDMLREFSDTGTLRERVTVNLENEEAEDAGGVFRDIISEFWDRLIDKYFEGENQVVPRIHCELTGNSWAAIGRILYRGYVQAKYLPLRFCRSSLAFCLFGETEDFEIMLLDSFLEYLPNDERGVMKKALQISQFPAGYSERFQDELIDILSKYDMRRLPTPDNINDLTLRSAQIALLERPHFPLHQMDLGQLKNLADFGSARDVDLLFKGMQPDGSKVAALLSSRDEDQICFSYLKWAVETFNEDLVKRFLRFVTGSDVNLGRKIQVDFVNVNGLSRRFVAHTCGPSLDVPSTYRCYEEFEKELREQLLSDHWEMEFA